MFGEFLSRPFGCKHNSEVNVARLCQIIAILLKTAKCISAVIVWKLKSAHTVKEASGQLNYR